MLLDTPGKIIEIKGGPWKYLKEEFAWNTP